MAIVITFQVVDFIQAWQGPLDPAPSGAFFQPLDTSNETQEKKGILYFGRDNLPPGGITSSGLVMGRGSKLCFEEILNGQLRYNCEVLASGGGRWFKKETTNDIFYDLGNVGIGTSNPQASLEVISSNNVYFGVSSVNIGMADSGALLNVYGNIKVERIFSDDSTGYVYQMLSSGETVDVKNHYNMDNPNFEWWKVAFPDKFGEFNSWQEARINKEITMGECEDNDMTTYSCWRNEPWPARPGSPKYVYDLIMFKSGDSFGISFIEFELKEVYLIKEGGKTSAYDGRFSGSVGVGDNPESRLDVIGEIKVSSSGEQCTNINAGAIRFRDGVFYGCDGIEWIPFISQEEPTLSAWQEKATFGGMGRESAIGFSIGDRGYIGTGYTPSGRSNDFWEYNPNTNSWTQKANVGGAPRGQAVAFSIGNRGYVGTGTNNTNVTNDFWEYNPSTNIWTRKANFPGEPRLSAFSFAIGSRGYIGGGAALMVDRVRKYGDFWEYNPSNDSWRKRANIGDGDFWEYNPSNDSWRKRANIGDGGGVAEALSFSIGNKGYVGLEIIYTGISAVLPGLPPVMTIRRFAEYDPSNNSWTSKAEYPGEGAVGVAFSIGDKGYVGLGSGRELFPVKDFWEFNPSTNSWKRMPDFLGAGRSWAVGFSIGDKGYIGTGYTGPVAVSKNTRLPIKLQETKSENVLRDFWEFSN